MSHDVAVRRALGALAERERRPEPRLIVASAETATGRVTDAAAVLAGDGCDRLEEAIERAERRGEYEVARTGRRVLATLARYRRVAHADHIHSGRGTVLHGRDQRADE